MEETTGLIAERGFWGLSLQDVADRCGLTVPGLLRHVGSKAGLLIAVLEHRDRADALSLRVHLRAGESQIPEDWSQGGPAGVDLRELCAATMRRNAAQPQIVQLFTVLAAESVNPRHPAHDYFVGRQQRAAAAFASLAQPLTDRPQELALHVMAMMDGLQLHWLREPDTTDLVSAWEAAAQVLFPPPRD
jgi:AcrR family transcriptional regulator